MQATHSRLLTDNLRFFLSFCLEVKSSEQPYGDDAIAEEAINIQ